MFDTTIGDNGLLPQIREGMNVRDSADKKIGTVRSVRMGDGNDPVDAQEQARDARGPHDDRPNAYDATLVSDLASTLLSDGDALPAEERQNLEIKGYIQIDSSGLFSADRYASADQIASVKGDDVILNVAGDTLAKSR